MGRRGGTAFAGGSSSYGYNAASQIVSRTSGNDSYAWTGALNVSCAYSVNGLNQYTAAGPAALGYDLNGNLSSSPDSVGGTSGTTSYTYDAENRLVAASGLRTASLSYDPMGRLFQTSGGSVGTTQFLYDGDELVAEYDGGGNLLRRYVHGTGVDDPVVWYQGSGLADRRSLFADHQGSIVAVANGSGAMLQINTYDPWGVPGGEITSRFAYTGQAWLPELGMYHYKARIYSPTLGRFLQTDPIGYKDQVNLYAYVGNDPVNKADPSGLAGIGHNSASFDELLEDAGKAGRWIAGRLAGAAAVLVSSTSAGPVDNPVAQRRIDFLSQRVANRQNVVNTRHIDGALREAHGEVVKLKANGKPFDHINELTEARDGLRADIRGLKEQFKHKLGEDQAVQVSHALGRASRLLDVANRVLTKVEKIRTCTGTRICP